jgi:alpha-beta hydrolase superfamily lysophospholipase
VLGTSRLQGACAILVLAAALPASAQPAGEPAWTKDVHLGDHGFEARTFAFDDDYDGKVTATLVRRPHQTRKRCAVLYLHGYVDYFFQKVLADFYEETLAGHGDGAGCDFFGLDLRKYGRSLPVEYPYPNFAKSLDEYFPEITKSLEFIQGEGYGWILLNGHSTGALIGARYLQDGRHKGLVNAFFLNSPFLDFNGAHVTGVEVFLARMFGWMTPHHRNPSPISRWYHVSLLESSAACRDCKGRWRFDLRLKPLRGFDVYLGWVRAVARAQRRVRKGGITQPMLVLHSTESETGEGTWQDDYGRKDLVLEVGDITKYAPRLGRHVTTRPIAGGLHDLVLSTDSVQRQMFDEIAQWLRSLPGGPLSP